MHMRPAPVVVHLRPSPPAPSLAALWVIAACTIGFVIVFLWIGGLVGWLNAGIFGLIGGAVFTHELQNDRRRRAAITQSDPKAADGESPASEIATRASPDPTTSAAAAGLAELFRQERNRLRRLPTVFEVKQLVQGFLDVPGGVLICLDTPEPPTVGDSRLEPELVSPARTVGSPLGWALLGATPFLIWAGQHVPGAPWRVSFWDFWFWLLAAAIWALIWTWHSMVRPLYLRIAPGVIQFLRYGPFQTKPRITEYAMQAGTLAILASVDKKMRLILSSGDSSDTIWLSDMQNPQQIIERVWHALLSTAPRPEMSEDELAG